MVNFFSNGGYCGVNRRTSMIHLFCRLLLNTLTLWIQETSKLRHAVKKTKFCECQEQIISGSRNFKPNTFCYQVVNSSGERDLRLFWIVEQINTSKKLRTSASVGQTSKNFWVVAANALSIGARRCLYVIFIALISDLDGPSRPADRSSVDGRVERPPTGRPGTVAGPAIHSTTRTGTPSPWS